MDKIRVGAVSYLNTKPLLYGITRLPVKDRIELITDYPANIAERLLEGSIDLGLVPVAVLPKMKEHHIVSDYCIGAEGPVASVALFSEKPIGEIKKVLLDYQSRTSVNLARVLLQNFWQKDVEYIEAGEGYQDLIKGDTAGVVIGDRAFEQRLISPFVYDLAEAWQQFTGLPFVFAAWVANKKLPDSFIEDFNHANAFGLCHLQEVIRENPYDKYDLHTYYTKNINYALSSAKKLGLQRFLGYLASPV
jgi:chorismate dehydratase